MAAAKNCPLMAVVETGLPYPQLGTNGLGPTVITVSTRQERSTRRAGISRARPRPGTGLARRSGCATPRAALAPRQDRLGHGVADA